MLNLFLKFHTYCNPCFLYRDCSLSFAGRVIEKLRNLLEACW